ncbi:MAG: glycosyltransferase family 87 protein [Candidatus Dormibacteria bacterium]
MTSKRSGPLTAAALCGAMLAAYLVLWVGVGALQIGRSDFTSTYIGATLLREGHGSSMYDEALQAPLHASLIAPDREGNLPFVNPPLAAALALPVSLLDLDSAYRLWSLLQFALLVVSVVVAIRAAPGRRRLAPMTQVAIGLVALACLGTWATLLLGQWDGVSALGLAVAYALLRHRRPGTAGAFLAVTALIGKPHLALGLAAFVVGVRDRRLILGAAAGVAASLLLSLLVAGPGGIAGFVGSAIDSTTRWQLANMVSLVGIAGSVAGNGTASHVMAAAGELVAVVLAAMLGWAVRRRPERLEVALAGAAVLSLLASPHAYWDDLALLVPAAAWSLAALAARRDGGGSLRTAVLAVWVAISVAAYLDISTNAAPPLGLLTPWALIAAAALAVAVCYRQGTPASPEAAGETAPWVAPDGRVLDVRPMSADRG